MKSIIDAFLQSEKIGIVGVSSNKQKFGNALYKELSSKGYDVYPVGRNIKSINGKDCFENVSSLYGLTDSVIIAAKKSDTADIIESIDASKIKRVWLINGSFTDESLNAARKKNLDVVHGACPLMFCEPNGFHKVHRFFSKLFGNYNKIYTAEAK
ncbi:MAG TPA: CoA-binding protein, partial [Ignavibacteria bacterium]|nr:CoA-binding protein [Ignavibacteria bacterium]